MNRGVRAWLVVGSLGVAVALAPNAHADEADDQKARGDAAMDAGRAAEALEAYEKAARQRWTPALDYNRGRAMLAMGDFAGALTAFESFSTKAGAELLEKTSRLPEIMAELRTKVSELVVTCASCGSGSTLTVRGKRESFGDKLRQNAGPAEVVVSNPGYETQALEVDLAPGATRTESVVLKAEATTGFLRISGAPAGTRVSTDGAPERPLGGTLELRPGPHELVLGAEGYERRHVSVVVDRGKEREISGVLTKKAPPLTSRPWFWVVVGAVVVSGATAAIVAGTQERPLDQGTLGTFRIP